jgi:hypothetical protein
MFDIDQLSEEMNEIANTQKIAQNLGEISFAANTPMHD